MNIPVFWPGEDSNRIWPGKTLIEYSHIVLTILSFSKCDMPELLTSIYMLQISKMHILRPHLKSPES